MEIPEKVKEAVTKNESIMEEKTTDQPVKKTNAPLKAKKPVTTKKVKKTNELDFAMQTFPKHVVEISLLLKNNAEIRRYTALGILNYLLQKKEISGDSRYVSFKWNKFTVKYNGLSREYFYSEPFFLNALVAAFTSFSASAQKTIDIFCKKEIGCSIVKAVDKEEVDQIATWNDEYENKK